MKTKFIKAMVLILAISFLSAPVMADEKTNNVKNVVVNTDNDDDIVARKISEKVSDLNSELFIASDSTFADSLVGGVLVAERNGRLLYNEKLDLEKDKDLLEASEAITILGGELRIKNDFIENSENFANRIFGENRYETAVRVAEKLGTDRDILIVNGEKYPDALSATALAVKEDMNILLVKKDSIPSATEEYLKACGNKKILFIGGNHSISKEVKENILEINGKTDFNSEELTLAGSNRYETSRIIAEKFDTVNSAVIVEGDNYIKALSASILAAKYGSPLILINPNAHIDTEISEKIISNLENIFLLCNINTMNIENLKEFYTEFIGEDYNEIVDLHGNKIEIESLTAIDTEISETEEDTPEEIKEDIIESKEEPEENKINEEDLIRMPSGDIINTANQTITLADGTVKKYKAVKKMNSTAYNIFPGSTGFTRSGTPARPGVVAVDPNVIPLMTKLYIVSTDEWPSYGLASAEDTGGAIIGDIVDLFYTSGDTVWEYGRRDVMVYILED